MCAGSHTRMSKPLTEWFWAAECRCWELSSGPLEEHVLWITGLSLQSSWFFLLQIPDANSYLTLLCFLGSCTPSQALAIEKVLLPETLMLCHVQFSNTLLDIPASKVFHIHSEFSVEKGRVLFLHLPPSYWTIFVFSQSLELFSTHSTKGCIFCFVLFCFEVSCISGWP